MATKNPSTPTALPQPQAGGRYKRNADGSLAVQHQTAQESGRSKSSRDALVKRLAEGAQGESVAGAVSNDTPKE